MDNSNNGYLIMLRYVMGLLLEKCEGQGSASEWEVYSYLYFHANFSNIPHHVPKTIGHVTEFKGQVAKSCEEIADYFGLKRGSIGRRIEKLIKLGFIRQISNGRKCNVYEIINYGQTKGTFKNLNEQPQNVDISNELNENSKSNEQPKLKNEQPNEQPQNAKNEQPQNVDISNENGNFSKSSEQPKNSASDDRNEQHYLINEELNKLPTTINLCRITCAQEILDLVSKDDNYFKWVQCKINIDIDDMICEFDKFYREQLEQNKQYKNAKEAKYHFVDWLNDILKKSYGTEIYNTFTDFSTQPKRLLYPLRMLSKKQKAEYAMMFNLDESQFDVILNEYLKTANEYRFKSFTEELQKLQFYVNNSDLQF